MQPTIHEAVRAVYSNVVIISGNDAHSLICLDQNNDEVTIVPETVEAKLTELQTNYTTQQQAAVTAKASTISKLTALGLTSDEIAHLIS